MKRVKQNDQNDNEVVEMLPVPKPVPVPVPAELAPTPRGLKRDAERTDPESASKKRA
jgi:hypothetical protein